MTNIKQVPFIDGKKPCRICAVHKEPNDFHVQPDASTGHHSVCKPCRSAIEKANRPATSKRAAEYRRQNPELILEIQRRHRLKKLFGMSLDEYDEMLTLQARLCAICRRPETAKYKNGRLRALAVDHDHVTGKVRGLLCTRCNTAIGLVDDDLERLAKIANYLESHG